MTSIRYLSVSLHRQTTFFMCRFISDDAEEAAALRAAEEAAAAERKQQAAAIREKLGSKVCMFSIDGIIVSCIVVPGMVSIRCLSTWF